MVGLHYNLGMNMSIDATELLLADTQQELEKVANWLQSCQTVAVDTESNSLYVYYEKVCLLQFSSPQDNALIDTLAFNDLSPLAPVFASAKIQKVFHAAEYDILCLKRDFAIEFNNIFDTLIASRILGRNNVGLGALIESEFGIHLEKKYQKANWGIRPISEDMLRYAVHDTDMLIDLKNKLEAELIERELMDLAKEDFERICKTHAGCSEPEPTNWWRVAGNNHGLDLQQIAMLQELCEWRERLAQKLNVPVFKVIQNNVLLELCQDPPQNESELNEIKGIRKLLREKYGKSLLKILRNQNRDIEAVPNPVKTKVPSQASLNRREALKNWRKSTGIKYKVPSDIILPRDIMEIIISKNPKNEEQIKRIMTDIPWRYNRFAAEILSVLEKQGQG